MSKRIEDIIDGMHKYFVKPPPEIIEDENLLKRLQEISTIVNNIKSYYVAVIGQTKEKMDNNLKTLSNIKIKEKAKVREINKYKKRMQKNWKDVEKANYNVMKSTNELLDLMKMIETIFDIKDRVERKNKQALYRDFFSIDNMGFSIDDGYSKKPSGKIPFFFQFSVFNLINNMLDLHRSIVSFIFHQSDIICSVRPDSRERNGTVADFFTTLFPQELKRKDCARIIIQELENAGFGNIHKSYILKQLSNWNVYNPVDKEKNKKQKRTEPLVGYENARKNTEEFFTEWVRSTYLVYYMNRKTDSSIAASRQRHFHEGRR